MNRQLATIQKISEIRNIPDAQKIQVAMMDGLGWECVIKKDDVKVGDLVVYFECDSILPETSWSEFLRERKFRIKIIKLKKQVSMGLIMPLSILPFGIKIEKGVDVTEILGITNYQKDVENAEEASLNTFKHRSKVMQYLMGYKAVRSVYFFLNPKQRKEAWPSWIQHTDEERCVHDDTLIKTDKGDVLITNLYKNHKDYKVLTFNEITQKNEFKRIINIHCNKNTNNWYLITTETGKTIKITDDHYVFLPKLNCYRQVKDLINEDCLLIS